MKGISSIFSSLIVTFVTLSLAVPLFIYFNSMYNTNQSTIGQGFYKLDKALDTQISVIKTGEYSNQTYIYNYGMNDVLINLVIINETSYKVSAVVKNNEIISLSSLIGHNVYIGNSTIILEANGNYYYI